MWCACFCLRTGALNEVLRLNPKSILRHGLLPAVAGVGCGLIFNKLLSQDSSQIPPDLSRLTPAAAKAPLPAGSIRSVPAPPNGPPVPGNEAVSSKGERLTLLAKNRRVEDLLVEIEKLPPGKDREQGVQLLMKEWFPLDRAAALAWMENLSDREDKAHAAAGMVPSWCKEDSHAASIWVAALPEGAAKRMAGNALADSMGLRDPEASLSWTLASRVADEPLEHRITPAVTYLAHKDYESAFKQITESNLSDQEKAGMEKKARAAWNLQRVREGKWQEILPMEGTTP